MIRNFSSKKIKACRFNFDGTVNAKTHQCLDNDVFKDFWTGFCFGASNIEFSPADAFVFQIGTVQPLEPGEYDYSINVTESGIAIYAKTEKGLKDGFCTLVEHIKAECTDEGKESFYIQGMELYDKPRIENRMIHYCVFPETEVYELERFINLCSVLRYTHIVLEFWGMVKLDCLKELSWDFAFSKDDVRPLIKRANDAGVQIIPMFNHWGHASSSRVNSGKHVVLDQNPKLGVLFDEYGWSWDITKAEVRSLHKKVRDELIELCGDGEYFHIGCDEAYGYEGDKEACKALAEYVNEINEELSSKGRRVIMWGDMFLLESRHNKGQKFYRDNREFLVCSCTDEETERILSDTVSKDIIIADWQYWRGVYPVSTSLYFKEKGFDVITCSWDISSENIKACCDTVCDNNLTGFMHTTWHTLNEGMKNVVTASYASYDREFDAEKYTNVIKPYTASLIRKIYFADGDYKKSGWVKKQL